MFDPVAFLDEQTESEFATEYTPVEVADYSAVIKKLEVSPPKEDGQSPILIVYHQIAEEGDFKGRRVRQIPWGEP